MGAPHILALIVLGTCLSQGKIVADFIGVYNLQGSIIHTRCMHSQESLIKHHLYNALYATIVPMLRPSPIILCVMKPVLFL